MLISRTWLGVDSEESRRRVGDFHDEYAFVLFGLLGFVYRCGAKRWCKDTEVGVRSTNMDENFYIFFLRELSYN